MIYDRFSRPLIGVRISITQRCNLDCIYCHREGVSFRKEDGIRESAAEMTPEEISRIVAVCAKNGVRKVKITGGEPLLRSDVCDVVQKISSVNGIEDISMTTNGVLLQEYAQGLKKAGLGRINVSLDTLKPEVFSMITGGGNLKQVVAGIDKAIEAGLEPVKLNMVVMKGINEREVRDMLREGVVLQLIELMNTDNGFFEKYFYDLDEIEKEFEREALSATVRKFMQNRRKYVLNGAQVEVIKPVHNTEFCASCTRIRITADGKFKPCLMRSDNLVDFLTPMRRGAGDKELEELLKEAMKKREPYFKA
ncbi:MAG: GTP 3',8-cyclase MoaA [Candidatus Hydrothermarchaeota archaeon]|nr:GTP 3',8-cyclase MoaA [Candidatus Hydrothermarchaeota archaeon]